jgi:hypothetical protein
MSTLSIAPAPSSPAAYGRIDALEASRVGASARAVKALEAENALQGAKATGPRAAVASAMDGLSTLAVAGALASLPAALGRMRDIAMAASSGTLTDADRETLQAEYSDLNRQVASAVGSVGTGEKASSSSDKEHEQDGGSPSDSKTGDRSRPAGTPKADDAGRTRTPNSTSTVATAAAHGAHDGPRTAAPRTAAARAASVAQFEHHLHQARSRISVLA